MIGAFLAGLGLGLSLIVAIGAQNAFVLRQGLAGLHVFAVCSVCAVSDAILIAAGVGGLGAVATMVPAVEWVMRLGGAAFLIWYGARSAVAAWRARGSLTASSGAEPTRRRAVLTALALTWLNPHVYLDTVLLLGSISAQYEARTIFAAGAITASFVFFFSLGYGAHYLRPVFARPRAWAVLDCLIALVMWSIAATLLLGK